jgi:hypothetical protein
MADYTVRVELRPGGDYNALHTAMERAGYKRFIVASDGSRYALPHAEYDLPGSNLLVGQVRDQALAIATSVHASPAPWVLATQATGRAWSTQKL